MGVARANATFATWLEVNEIETTVRVVATGFLGAGLRATEDACPVTPGLLRTLVRIEDGASTPIAGVSKPGVWSTLTHRIDDTLYMLAMDPSRAVPLRRRLLRAVPGCSPRTAAPVTDALGHRRARCNGETARVAALYEESVPSGERPLLRASSRFDLI